MKMRITAVLLLFVIVSGAAASSDLALSAGVGIIRGTTVPREKKRYHRGPTVFTSRRTGISSLQRVLTSISGGHGRRTEELRLG